MRSTVTDHPTAAAAFIADGDRARWHDAALWAARSRRDGAEHNRIVSEILTRHGVKRVVKSKSMLTEECSLNPHLENQGIEITDTDLGEWIVQLRHEHPSHIVTPAIHIKKEEVGELFHRTLGTTAGATDP